MPLEDPEATAAVTYPAGLTVLRCDVRLPKNRWIQLLFVVQETTVFIRQLGEAL